MLGTLFGLLSLGIAAVGGVFAFGFARGFVRRRLRFVDAIRSRWVPYLAGLGVALLLSPLTVIPLIGKLIGVGTLLAIGLGTGFGTASGVKALKRGD